MMEPKFKVGDRVILLDGSDIPTKRLSWLSRMDEFVGEATIREVFPHEDRVSYHIDGCDLYFDELWFEEIKEDINTDVLCDFLNEYRR